ncbi:MAG: tripartite tricarboxylate transporter substrate binding protein [Betaproteobacteria bacterium]|nr:tripartite tricarboxylate transporter substrate binding protein [Betaproteobacteria bacterium]
MPVKHLLFFLSWLVTLSALAQPYPSRPVRLLVGFVPGGGTDIMGRAIATKLGDISGIQMIIENRPGANGNLAAELVARSPADGYTLLMMSTSHAISKPLYKTLKYDIEKDLVPVAFASSGAMTIVVNPVVPASSLRELIALARAKPGELSYGSSGPGSPEHMAAELFLSMAKVRMVHVPYKGGAASATDLIGGQIQVGFNTLPVVMPYIRAGKMRLLAVTEDRRSPAFPDAPTVAEAGVPGYAMPVWYGIMAPAGTPRETIGLLNREIERVLREPDIRERFATLGVSPTGGAPEAFGAFLREEVSKFTRLVADTGLTVE